MEVDGVGGVKVFPLGKGAGTVKCVIANKDYTVAPEELLERVRVYVESVRPLGADVTIQSAKEKSITISATLDLDKNFSIEDVKAAYTNSIEDYLRSISFEAVEVKFAKVGSLLLNTPGVNDYTELKLNGGLVNVELTEEEVPTLKAINLVAEEV